MGTKLSDIILTFALFTHIIGKCLREQNRLLGVIIILTHEEIIYNKLNKAYWGPGPTNGLLAVLSLMPRQWC